MALIKCDECGAEVSDKATACVKCGAPLVMAMANDDDLIEGKPTVVEQTSKRLKSYVLLWFAIILAGLAIMMTSEGDRGGYITGIILIGTGILGVIITNIMIWWQHG